MLQEDISKSTENFERYRERLTNFSTEFELGLFIFIARKSLVWILLFLSIAFVGAYLYLRYTPNVYESSSVLQINSSNKANSVLNMPNVYDFDEGNLARSIELMRSKVFLKRAFSTLPLEISYFEQGTFKMNEHYKSSQYTVSHKLISESIQNVPITIDFKSPSGGNLSYMMGGQNYSKPFRKGEPVVFPHVELTVFFKDDFFKRKLISKTDSFSSSSMILTN